MAWNPRPSPYYDTDERKGYHAGYSDGWYGYPFGAAYADRRPQSYSLGFKDAVGDKLEAEVVPGDPDGQPDVDTGPRL